MLHVAVWEKRFLHSSGFAVCLDKQTNKLRNSIYFLNPLSTIVPNACCMLLFERNALYYRSLLKNWKSFLHSIGFAVSEPFLASRIEPACLFGCMCYVIPASIGGQEVEKKWGLKWVRKQSYCKTIGKIKNILKTVHWIKQQKINYVFAISNQSNCLTQKVKSNIHKDKTYFWLSYVPAKSLNKWTYSS